MSRGNEQQRGLAFPGSIDNMRNGRFEMLNDFKLLKNKTGSQCGMMDSPLNSFFSNSFALSNFFFSSVFLITNITVL